jgi:hypothetical protein
MRGVRGSIDKITALCHREPFFEVRRSMGWLVTGESLLAPWIAVDVITAQLPKASFVAASELQT